MVSKNLALTIISLFSFQSFSALSIPLQNANTEYLIAQNDGYREHYSDDNNNEFENNHSENHKWQNHYHSISSISLKSNGNLKIKFCEKVEKLQGQIYANDVKYDVKDAYKIRKRSIVWRIKKKNTFEKGQSVEINTFNFLGRPIEKEPNPNEIRYFERGCGLAYAFIPKSVKVKGNDSGLAALGLALIVGIAAGSGGSGSGSSSSN